LPARATTPSPATSNCTWESVAAKYGLNPYLLHAIAKQESGLNPQVISKPNSNRSVDIGLMQINSSWIPTLSKRFGIQREDLFRSCVNLDVGAWVLYENFKTHGNSWRAIGAYNAKTDWKRLNYVHNVYRYVPPALKQ
jgi:soluble lytic murein transglycosylase-like protein